MERSFSPELGTTVNIDVSSSAQYIQITKDTGIRQIRVMNNGTATVWVKFGIATGDAATLTTDFPVGPGVTEVFTAGGRLGPIWASAMCLTWISCSNTSSET